MFYSSMTVKHKRVTLNHTPDNIYDHAQYQCPNCDKTFRREAALNRHVEYDHIKKEDSGEEAEDPDRDEEEDYAPEPEPDGDGEEGAGVSTVYLDGRKAPQKTPNVNSEEYQKRPFGCNLCKARFREVISLF